MSRKTWQQLAQQQSKAPVNSQAAPAAPSLQQLASQVPGLRNLLQQRQTLEHQMQSLGSEPGAGPAQRTWPVASARERRDEYRRWEQQREAGRSALNSNPQRQAWQQQRDQQVAEATGLSLQRQQLQRSLNERLDQRVNQARQALNSHDPRLKEPLLRPLQDRLEHAFQAPAVKSEPTSLAHFDNRWQQRQQRLLSVETGPLDALQQRSEQLFERRQEERLEARREERRRSLLQERADERRRQRIQTSSY